jgi:hypothetical protein
MGWTTILNILNGFLSVVDRCLSAWHDSQERQAGRNEVTLENYKQDLSNLEKAHEIDQRPPVSDVDALLERMRYNPKLK